MAMIDKYLKIPVEYAEYVTDVSISETVSSDSDIFGLDATYNSDFNNIGTYKEPVTIMCSMDRDVRVTFTGNEVKTVSNVLYLTKEKITPKSLLDGHIISVVTPVYDLNGKISHYESSMV